MRVGIMVTDGGPHPPEKWAEVTADQIIEIGSTAPEALVKEARTFRTKLVAILVGHHGLVQDHERDQIAKVGHERLAMAIDPSGHVPDALAAIVAASKGTSFAAHFAKAETQEYLTRVLGSHFATSMHIERSWHADRNPDAPQAKAFRAKWHPGSEAGR